MKVLVKKQSKLVKYNCKGYGETGSGCGTYKKKQYVVKLIYKEVKIMKVLVRKQSKIVKYNCTGRGHTDGCGDRS